MKNFLNLLLLMLPFNLYSQTDSTKIAFISYWSKGDSYDFKISKSQQVWTGDSLTRDKKNEYIVNFSVIDSTKNSYKIKWSFEENLGRNYDLPTEYLERISKKEITDVIYKTSEYGDFIEIINWKEISNYMTKLITETLKLLDKKNEKTDKNYEKSMKSILDVYSSKQSIEQVIMKEIQYFHLPLGREYDIREPLHYQTLMPNMYGGEPIKANVKMYFTEVDFEEGFCILNQESIIDSEDSKKILFQVFKLMKVDEDKMNEELKKSTFEINEKNTFEYFYNPGIPHKIESIRESIINVKNEKTIRVDKTTIELIYKD